MQGLRAAFRVLQKSHPPAGVAPFPEDLVAYSTGGMDPVDESWVQEQLTRSREARQLVLSLTSALSDREGFHEDASDVGQGNWEDLVSRLSRSEIPAPTEFGQEIADLYSRIASLRERPRRSTSEEHEIARLYRRLRFLQAQQASVLVRQFRENLDLRPGDGWSLLQKAQRLVGDA